MTQAGFLSLAPGRALVSVTDEDVQALMEAVRKCPGHAAAKLLTKPRPASRVLRAFAISAARRAESVCAPHPPH
jgi:hypothetical protein